MEKYVEMKSPFTGGRVKEVTDIETKEFRREKFQVSVTYYVCEDTNEQFTTAEQDQQMLDSVYAQYRRRHGIPTPETIRAIRLQYGLTLTRMSELLGFGANQYAQYEKGEMPSESNGKIILLAAYPTTMKILLDSCREKLGEVEYERIKRHVAPFDVNPLSREFSFA